MTFVYSLLMYLKITYKEKSYWTKKVCEAAERIWSATQWNTQIAQATLWSFWNRWLLTTYIPKTHDSWIINKELYIWHSSNLPIFRRSTYRSMYSICSWRLVCWRWNIPRNFQENRNKIHLQKWEYNNLQFPALEIEAEEGVFSVHQKTTQ